MSYVPSHVGAVQLLANPDALVFCDVELNGTCSNGTVIEYLNPQTQFGSWTVSITNGVITLPSGYWYFLEGTTQFYPLGDFYNHTLETQWYNETSSAYVGTKTFMAPQITEQDDQATSRADTARVLIDCTSSGITISNKVLNTNSSTPLNYTLHTQEHYGSFGRCVIWRLSA